MNHSLGSLMSVFAIATFMLGTPDRSFAGNACETGKLLEVKIEETAEFGTSVAIDGNVAVIGAPHWGVPYFHPGAAHIFRFDGSSWVHEQELLSSDGEVGDEFGYAVAIDGDTVVVGARSNDPLTWTGSAYVFRFNGETWIEEQQLMSSDAAPLDRFGHAVAISGGTAVITATGADGASIDSGAAYMFSFDGSSWVEQQKIFASDGEIGDIFGKSLAMSGNALVIGAHFEDDNGSQAGAAYIFRFDGSSWVEEQKLLASNGNAWFHFGFSAAISGDTAVIGHGAYVFQFDGSSWNQVQQLFPSQPTGGYGYGLAIFGDTIVIGAINDPVNGPESGAAFLFRFDGSTWLEEDMLFPVDVEPQDHFGRSVAIDGDTAMIGAPNDSDFALWSGAVYVFTGLYGIDCNANGESDSCDLFSGTSDDRNGNGIPDECESTCPADIDGNGSVGILDLLAVLAAWGTDPGGPPDFDGDGDVGILDLLALLAAWGPCSP